MNPVPGYKKEHFHLNSFDNPLIKFFFFQSGLCSSSNLETSRGSIRIHHLTGSLGGGLGSGLSGQPLKDQPRFPRLEDCAHFHYEFTEVGPISVTFFSLNLFSGTLSKERERGRKNGV